jgi:hypothetical protein
MNGWRSAVNNPIAFAGGDRGPRSFGFTTQFAAEAPRLQRNLGADIALRKECIKEWPKMKLCFGSVIAAALWATIAQTQALPNGPGLASSMPVSLDDRPLMSRPGDYPLSATGVTAGMPGPYLPNPNDPTRLSPTYSGGSPPLFVEE